MVEDSRMGKHLMRVDKKWKEIMNLYPISKLGKVGALISEFTYGQNLSCLPMV